MADRIFTITVIHPPGSDTLSETFQISEKYIESVKLELVRFELKSEGIDP